MTTALDMEVQPWLIDAPQEPELVARVKDYAHTGKLLLKDDERTRLIVSAALLRMPKREIARRFHVATETVDALVAVLEQTGKLRALKDELTERVKNVVFAASDRLIDEMHTLPANVVSFTFLNGLAKLLLLTGQATERVEINKTDERTRVLEELERWARRHVGSSACQSDAICQQVVDVECSALTTTDGNTSLRTAGAPETCGSGAAVEAAVETAGGSLSPAAPSKAMDSPAENF